MKRKLIEKADKLLEMSMPLLDKLTDDTDDEMPEKALDACTKMVELAHYLYEICEMKHKMMDADDTGRMEYAEGKKPGLFDNPKKDY